MESRSSMTAEDEMLAKEMESRNERNRLTLLQQEQQKRARFDEENLKHAQASSRVKDLYQEALERYKHLSAAERMLSAQAGQLLSALQREEARAAKLSSTVRKIRHTRKKMLNNIANPRWEVRHHYHMTCLEHALGHTQPHVLEVGQMVSGHLRLFTFARLGVLVHKSLILSLNRAKCARNNFSEKIKDVYRSLRLTRQDLKEQSKLLDAMREKSHLLEKETVPRPVSSAPGTSRQSQSSSFVRDSGPLSIKMRYFKSLHMSPDNIEVQKLLQRWENDLTQDWKRVVTALTQLEKQTHSKRKAKEELKVVESFVQNFSSAGGLATLPGPLGGLNTTMEGLSLNDEEEDDIDAQQSEALFEGIEQSMSGDPNTTTQQEQSKEDLAKERAVVEKGKLPDPKRLPADQRDLEQAQKAKELLHSQQKQQTKKSGSSPWGLFAGKSRAKSISKGPSSRTRNGSMASVSRSTSLIPEGDYF